jgi:hypothetical protein
MITFKNILQEYDRRQDHRSKVLPNLNFEKYVGYNIGDIKNATSIYRGLNNKNNKYLFIQPSKFERKSANTLNFYTILIDNSKYWKEYPKRSKSICCTNNKSHVKYYFDNIYRVYPKIGARIGVCPAYDIFYSFEKGLKILSNILHKKISDLSEFEDFLYLETHVYGNYSYKKMINNIDKYNLNDKQKLILLKYNCKTLYEFIDYCLSPELNGFALLTYNDGFEVYNKEIWTDADSLMIKVS